MMTRVIYGVVMGTALVGMAQAGDMELSEQIESLSFVERTDYESEELGYDLRFEGDGLLKVNVHVYNGGLEEGMEFMEILWATEGEMDEAKGVLQEAVESGHYRDVEALESGTKEFDDAETEFHWSKHRLRQVAKNSGDFEGPQISEVYLAAHDASFIKIRATTKESDYEDHQKEIDALVRAVADQIKRSNVLKAAKLKVCRDTE